MSVCVGGDHSFCESWKKIAFGIVMSHRVGWAALEERSGWLEQTPTLICELSFYLANDVTV